MPATVVSEGLERNGSCSGSLSSSARSSAGLGSACRRNNDATSSTAPAVIRMPEKRSGIGSGGRRAWESGAASAKLELRQRRAYLTHLGRLVQHKVYVRRHFAFSSQALSPAGEQDYRRAAGYALDRACDLASIDVGHAQIGDDGIEHRDVTVGAHKCIDTCLATAGGHNGMSVELERLAQGLQHQRIVVDEQDAQPRG